jgi:hypothetical protein
MVSADHASHGDDCRCGCWHCTIGPAVDRAIVSGHRVAITETDQLVMPDTIVLELAANGINVTDHAGYRTTHRAGKRTCWVLGAGDVA